MAEEGPTAPGQREELRIDTAIERILVALDTSQSSLLALHAAAELAAMTRAEIRGIFVEDVNLVRLCALPFLREVGSYSARLRPVKSHAIEHDFQVQAARMRHAVAQAAVASNISWSFQVTRGTVLRELQAAAQEANLITLGRIGRSWGKRFGSTARALTQESSRPVFLLDGGGLAFPLTALYTGSPAADRALELAATLLRHRDNGQLHLLIVQSDAEPTTIELARRRREELNQLGIKVTIRAVADQGSLLRSLEERPGTLLVSAEYAHLIETIDRSIILVP